MNYTNAQFRSILNGLGYREELPSDRDYPISDDESPMTDDITVEAIMAFQAYFNIQVDGIAGPETLYMASVEMETLHMELNQVMGSEIPAGEPFYGPMTIAAVQSFERAKGFFAIDGVASLLVRQALYQQANANVARNQRVALAV
jgi:peptidoglycan hydrolase-like protein with peptidoglycan-binding domain